MSRPDAVRNILSVITPRHFGGFSLANHEHPCPEAVTRFEALGETAFVAPSLRTVSGDMLLAVSHWEATIEGT
jgi:hypothetical protein